MKVESLDKDIPAGKVLESLTSEPPRRAKFWRLFQRASLEGTTTKGMREYGETLQTKQDRAIKLFNWITGK